MCLHVVPNDTVSWQPPHSLYTPTTLTMISFSVYSPCVSVVLCGALVMHYTPVHVCNVTSKGHFNSSYSNDGTITPPSRLTFPPSLSSPSPPLFLPSYPLLIFLSLSLSPPPPPPPPPPPSVGEKAQDDGWLVGTSELQLQLHDSESHPIHLDTDPGGQQYSVRVQAMKYRAKTVSRSSVRPS